jgi:hypothetical protein
VGCRLEPWEQAGRREDLLRSATARSSHTRGEEGSTALGVGRSSSVMLPLPHGEGEAGELRGAGSPSRAAEVG